MSTSTLKEIICRAGRGTNGAPVADKGMLERPLFVNESPSLVEGSECFGLTATQSEVIVVSNLSVNRNTFGRMWY